MGEGKKTSGSKSGGRREQVALEELISIGDWLIDIVLIDIGRGECRRSAIRRSGVQVPWRVSALSIGTTLIGRRRPASRRRWQVERAQARRRGRQHGVSLETAEDGQEPSTWRLDDDQTSFK